MALTDVIKRFLSLTSLDCVALNQNRNKGIIWSVEMCFIFLDQTTSYLCNPFTKQLFGVTAFGVKFYSAIIAIFSLSFSLLYSNHIHV